MTVIRLYDHPFASVEQRFNAPSLAEWLLSHYGETPTVNLQIYAGEPCGENEITGNLAALLANDQPEYVVLQSPGAGLDPVSLFFVNLAINFALGYVISALFPPPEQPANVNRTQASPNNQLGNRNNANRVLQRVEDIYGTVKSIPSLMMPTYIKYLDHTQYEYGYYCVGRGYYSLANIKDGDTLLSDYSGASAAVFDPFTSPNSGTPVLQIGNPITDRVLSAKRASQVDGITLKAYNQVQLPASSSYTFGTNNTITQSTKQPNVNVAVKVDNFVVVSMSNVVIASSPGTPDSTDPNTGVVTPGTPATTGGTYNYSGRYRVTAVADGVITVAVSTAWGATITTTCSVLLDPDAQYTSWVTLPDKGRTEVWVNVVAANGIYKDSGGGKAASSVQYTIQIEQLDPATLLPMVPAGIIESVNSTLTGLEGEQRAETLERITLFIGPCRVRMNRQTNYDYAFKGTIVDEIKWTDLYAVTPTANTDFGNKTTIQTVTSATQRATSARGRELNCLASRKLPTYNGTTFSGAFDSKGSLTLGGIYPTSKIVDILAAVSIDPKIGRRDLATEVDMAQIYATQQALDAWSASAGQFNYTFDSDGISFEETLVTIANAAFCVAYRQNGKLRLSFDRAQANATALFTHRNKKPASETISRAFATDANGDGVEFLYQDPTSEQTETIKLPLDGSATKYKKFEIPGIRSYTQAWYRASREYAKLVGQRLTIDTTCTTDARLLIPNSRIEVVDNTKFTSYDGEVLAQAGLTLTLNRDVLFTAGASHSLILMQRAGGVQAITCTAGAAANQVVLVAAPTEAIVTSADQDGIRTIFSFAADTARAAQAWLVQEVGASDGQYVSIKAINYADAYYAGDTAAVPARASVIY